MMAQSLEQSIRDDSNAYPQHQISHESHAPTASNSHEVMPSQQCQPFSQQESDILIVDMEGFTLKDEFFVKELAFYNPCTMQCWVGTFKPPYDKKYIKSCYSKTMREEAIEMHGLKWDDDGLYPYSMAFTMINRFANTHQLLAKGRRNCLWLQQYTDTILIDLEQYGCPPASELPFGCYCQFHNSTFKSCALDKAVRMGRYYVNLFTMKPIVTE